jgi:hypothetical protein
MLQCAAHPMLIMILYIKTLISFCTSSTCHHYTFSTSQHLTFCSAYLWYKDEQELPGNLNNRKCISCFTRQMYRLSLFLVSLLSFSHRKCGSSVSIVSAYGLDDRAIGVRSSAEAGDFSSSLCVQTGSWTHPAFHPMGTGCLFHG